jgi:hypothetical protein
MRSVPQSAVPQSPFLWTCGIAARETLRLTAADARDVMVEGPHDADHPVAKQDLGTN